MLSCVTPPPKATSRSTPSACEFAHPAEFLAGLCSLERTQPHGRTPRLRALRANPDHPSLRFKKLGGYDRVWSVRVNEQYRAIGERRGDTIVWAWVGTHNEFDNLFG